MMSIMKILKIIMKVLRIVTVIIFDLLKFIFGFFDGIIKLILIAVLLMAVFDGDNREKN